MIELDTGASISFLNHHHSIVANAIERKSSYTHSLFRTIGGVELILFTSSSLLQGIWNICFKPRSVPYTLKERRCEEN